MSDVILKGLQKKLAGEVTRFSEDVCKGGVDYPEYKKLCGVIQGLTTALEMVEDLAKQMEGDLDD